MEGLEIESFFCRFSSPGSRKIVVVVDTCSFIKYHEILAKILPTLHHLRNDLKFFFPWVVHQELDAMKSKHTKNEWDPHDVSSAVGVISSLLDLSCEHNSVAYTFQSSNEAATCSAANLPHNANDDDILLSALYLCHKDTDGLDRVFVWSIDKILVNKVRVSGLSAITEQDNKLVVLTPPTLGTHLLDNNCVIRNVAITPPDESPLPEYDGSKGGDSSRQSASDMAVDSGDEELNLAGCCVPTSTNNLIGRGYFKNVRSVSNLDYNNKYERLNHRGAYTANVEASGSSMDWKDGSEGIVPRNLQRKMPIGRTSLDEQMSGLAVSKAHNAFPQSSFGTLNTGYSHGAPARSPAQHLANKAWELEALRPHSAAPVVTLMTGNTGYPVSSSTFYGTCSGQQPQTKRRSSTSDALSLFLVDVVCQEMVSAYGADIDIWSLVCCLRRKPTNWRDAIVCIDRHWIAVFKHVFGTAKTVTVARETILRLAKSNSVITDELMNAGRTLANCIAGHPMHSATARQFLRAVPFVAAS